MSRYFAFFALFALAAAYPASDDIPRPITTITESDFEDPSPWFRFPPFGNIFAPLTKLFSSFADIGPRIEVDDDKFRVIVNVKDYKKEDLKVKVKGDFILVQGAHEAKHDDHDLFASQFFHTYTLPFNASAKDVTATYTSDGYLDVTAPINGADEKEKVLEREVPIVASGKPLKEEKEPAPLVPVPPVDKVENTDTLTNANENFDKVEPLNAPLEPLAKIANVDKIEAVENVDKVEPTATVEKVENQDKVENVEPTAAVEEAENRNKVENVEPTDTVEKVEIVEPTAAVEKVENVDPTAAVEKVEIVEPTAAVEKVENVNKIEQPVPVTEAAYEAEADKKEATTPSSDREEFTVPVEDIKVPQDNEVNEIQP